MAGREGLKRRSTAAEALLDLSMNTSASDALEQDTDENKENELAEMQSKYDILLDENALLMFVPIRGCSR